ncbi:hypothetical protein GCM10023310_15590 [Paenibacillus vulneris]|uniref:GyrI-like domain-containing protein n=1 Tax=Paenibacillus vulneris TaxID=1133364 RepID=A0ABW3UI98_9BACL
MSEQKTVEMESLWSTRTERFQGRWFVGVQNPLPQSYEDEKQLFARLDARKHEISGPLDENTYMLIHENGSRMTVGLRVDQPEEIPEGMVSLHLPDEEYAVFRFEEKYICSFWQFFCTPAHQKKYGLDIAKARFETFNETLQPRGITEIYFPKVTE